MLSVRIGKRLFSHDLILGFSFTGFFPYFPNYIFVSLLAVLLLLVLFLPRVQLTVCFWSTYSFEKFFRLKVANYFYLSCHNPDVTTC